MTDNKYTPEQALAEIKEARHRFHYEAEGLVTELDEVLDNIEEQKQITKSLYEIDLEPGGVNPSYKRCYVWAQSNSQTAALAAAVNKHGKKIIDNQRKIIELFTANADDFCTLISDSGFEKD